jgi:hypothetical protein
MPAAKGSRSRTLILHIGDHKTGSTSIQLAFAKGQVTLKDHSVFYPAQLASNGLGGHIRAYCAADTDTAREKAAVPIRKLADRVRASESDFTLISAEVFETIPPEDLREILDTFFVGAAEEIRIFGYVRPHAARITSSFAERIKVGTKGALTATLDEFANRRRLAKEFLYLPRFTAWRDCFGSAFTLRPMIRNQMHNGSVVEDFIHHAFNRIPYSLRNDNTDNESLCLEDLMRLKVVQQSLQIPQSLHLKVGWELARLLRHLPPAPTRTKLELHRSLAKKIHKTYIEDARAMDKTFFGNQPLMQSELELAIQKAIAKPLSTNPTDYLDTSELHSLKLMAAMVDGMLEADSVNWSAFLHQKRINDVRQACE